MDVNINEYSIQYTPILIPNLNNTIDVMKHGEGSYHIALCSANDKSILLIIYNLCRTHSAPQEIVNLLINYTKITDIYATTTNQGTGHPENVELKNKNGFNKVSFFDDKCIVKISVGHKHTLFLDNNGIIWVSGGDKFSVVLGLDDIEYTGIYSPVAIPYFVNNGIKIKDIASGIGHNLAVDINGRLYSWGMNACGPCGVGHRKPCPPTLIDHEDLRDYKVDLIRCGDLHSYARTECGRHYLFGLNNFKQCLNFNQNVKQVCRPYRVDQIVNKNCNGRLLEVCPGYRFSAFIVSIASK